MHNFGGTSCVKASRSNVDNMMGLYTNPQVTDVLGNIGSSYTSIHAHFMCSVSHTVNRISDLLNKLVHSIPRPYNYYYLYILNNKGA